MNIKRIKLVESGNPAHAVRSVKNTSKIVSGTSLEKYEFYTQLMLRIYYHNLDC